MRHAGQVAIVRGVGRGVSRGVGALGSCALAFALLLVGPPDSVARGRRARLPGVAVDGNHVVGKPVRVGALSVFPVYAHKQTKLGRFVTLREAVASKKASVSELGTASARVSTILVINNGSDPILILGGTVILGGKQDRQIGEDTIVGARSRSHVKVFCVERGRWTSVRGGRATQGKFTVLEVLATRTVRNAGQYRADQAAVWRNVSKHNRQVGKRSRTDSLLVSVNDPKVKKQRAKMTARAVRYLDKLTHRRKVVGLAFAVAGKPSSVRWFSHHGVYRRFRTILINTAATEALAARGTKLGRRARASDVKSFLASLRQARKLRTDRRSYNKNVIRASFKGYSAETYYSAGRRAAARRSRHARPRARPAHRSAPVTVDHSVR